MLRDRDTFLIEVRERLLQAQEHARRYYNAKHRDVEFVVGDWVLLRLLHRPAQSLLPGPRSKLSPRYAGPFQVVERVGSVAYRLHLPDNARLHDVFHVGVLKQLKGPLPASTAKLPPLHNGCVLQRSERALRSQLRRGTWQVLIQ